jgi:hypothetical protein
MGGHRRRHADAQRLEPAARLVRRFHALLTEERVRGGAQRGTAEVEAAIPNYLAIDKEHPKPFVWTKTADQIHASESPFFRRTTDGGH